LLVIYSVAEQRQTTGALAQYFEPMPTYKLDLGSINGYVAGPLGLPAVGSTVIAAEQGGTGVTKVHLPQLMENMCLAIFHQETT
jgi:hypothetical protein